METLNLTIIKNQQQYNEYCNRLENLLSTKKKHVEDEIELLTILIEKWDNEHITFDKPNPIELLKSLMTEHKLKDKDLSRILGISAETIANILNYHKGLSKETIKKLSDYFKVSQDAFNRPYRLVDKVNRRFKYASLMNTKKEMQYV